MEHLSENPDEKSLHIEDHYEEIYYKTRPYPSNNSSVRNLQSPLEKDHSDFECKGWAPAFASV